MNSLNNLIQSHDMYDEFESSSSDAFGGMPQQPPFVPPTSIISPTKEFAPVREQQSQPTYTERAPQPAQYIAPFHTQQQQPAPDMNQMALSTMLMEIQDIERRLHVLFHSCQRLMQHGVQPPIQAQRPMMQVQQPTYAPQPMPMQQAYQTPPMQSTQQPVAPVPEALGIKEGVFNGEHMISADGETYKVPPTFACRAKLIEGDFMKAQIFSNGQVKFKQSEPSERENIMGILSTLSANTPYYIVQTASKAYKVLSEAVDMHKGNPGAQVLLIVPLGGESEWAAIESIYPVA